MGMIGSGSLLDPPFRPYLHLLCVGLAVCIASAVLRTSPPEDLFPFTRGRLHRVVQIDPSCKTLQGGLHAASCSKSVWSTHQCGAAVQHTCWLIVIVGVG